MIAIPNMEKPKNCYHCSFNDGIFCALIDNDTDAFIKDNPTEVATKVLPDCPLIEIVRCGECKYLEVVNKAPIYAHCHKWDYDFELWKEDTRKSFCSYGERRTDEDI